MANQAFSDATDLMVGAGELYFKRKKSDGTYESFHHMGNVDEFTITNDLTKIEKSSSMNKARDLMAEVITAIKPTGSLTMTEYDPYQLALGLYGVEGTMEQLASTQSAVAYQVETVPGIIQVIDNDGNSVYNILNVVVAPSVPVAAHFDAITTVTSLGSSGSVVSAIDSTAPVGSKYSGTVDKDFYIKITKAPTATGDLAGTEFAVANSSIGIYTPQPALSAGTTATNVSLGNNLVLNWSISTGQTFNVGEIYHFKAYAALTAYTIDKDYLVEEQSSRAGLVKIPASSRIKAGDVVKLTLDIPAGKYPKVAGGIAGNIEGQLLFIGDPNNGGKYNIEAWKVKVTPDGAMTGLIGTEFGNFKLNLAFQADRINHKDDPYYKAVLVGKAT